MRIDLSKSGRLTVSQAKQLTAVADRVRGLYNEMIEKLSEGNEGNIDWWVSNVASRNTYASSLFRDCCYTLLAMELLESGEIDEIVVDSKALSRVLMKLCEKKKVRVRVIFKRGCLQPFLFLLKGVLGYIYSLVIHVFRYLLCRFALPPSVEPLPTNCTLIDLFILDQSFITGQFKDRYYENFGGFLTEKERAAHIYMPTFLVHFWNLIGVIRAVRSSDKRFLLYEDMLKVSDFAYAWAYPFRISRFFPKKTLMDGLDVTPLLRQAWLEQLFSSSAMEALLKFRFPRRLKDRGVSVRLVIDWFENQNIDKGSNAGFRKFYPETPIIGYQGFDTQKYYLCAYPNRSEHQSGVLPHTVAVCGRALVEERRQFFPELDVVTAPAFRYVRAWNDRAGKEKSEYFLVLIPLPLETDSAANIVATAVELIGLLPSGSVRFWLKPHPAAQMETIIHRAGLSLPPEIKVVKGDYYEYLEQVDMLMGDTSSTILEAIAWGIPVIIVTNRYGITHNPVPETVPEDMWCLCYTKEEMAEAISRYAARSDEDRMRGASIGRVVRENYFEPVTRESVRAFLRLSDS